MEHDVWKEFEANTLTHSNAHYLTAVHELLVEHGYARVTDVAKRLGVTRGSCSVSLRPLKKRGLITEDDNKFLGLSEEGRRLAEVVEHNAELVHSFLAEVLGVDDEQAEVDACKIEHLISIQTSMRLRAFMESVTGGGPAIQEWLNGVRAKKSSCTSDVETCPVCQTVCFMEIGKHSVVE
ncbi:MAG TPA: hypothetical protein DCR55_02090 [Lentisphaeria bacterium]|nr:hypothetical protein [Lentisphaeria bacterium]